MVKANQCDINCPVTVLGGLEHRLSTEQTGVVGRLAVNVGTGIVGVHQAGYAGFMCPNRGQQSSEWRPSPRCMTKVVDRLGEMVPGIAGVSLTAHEEAVLGPIISQLQQEQE